MPTHTCIRIYVCVYVHQYIHMQVFYLWEIRDSWMPVVVCVYASVCASECVFACTCVFVCARENSVVLFFCLYGTLCWKEKAR